MKASLDQYRPSRVDDSLDDFIKILLLEPKPLHINNLVVVVSSMALPKL